MEKAANTHFYLLQNDPTSLINQHQTAIDAIAVQLVSEKYAPTLVRLLQPILLAKLKTYATQNNPDIQTSVAAQLLALAHDAATQTCEQICKKGHPDLTEKEQKDLGDLYLLLLGSNQLIQRYEALIRSRLYHYLNQNTQLKTLEADLYQEVYENLWRQLSNGKWDSFKGNSLFSTYMYKVVTFAVIASIKKSQKGINLAADDISNIPEPSVSDNKEYVNLKQHHLQLLTGFMQVFPSKKKPRFELCLQTVYRLLLKAFDIKNPYPQAPEDLVLDILLVFGRDYLQLSTEEIFTYWADFLLDLEDKPIKVGALKKWFHRQKNTFWKVLFDEELVKSKSQEIDQYFELLVHEFYGEL